MFPKQYNTQIISKLEIRFFHQTPHRVDNQQHRP